MEAEVILIWELSPPALLSIAKLSICVFIHTFVNANGQLRWGATKGKLNERRSRLRLRGTSKYGNRQQSIHVFNEDGLPRQPFGLPRNDINEVYFRLLDALQYII